MNKETLEVKKQIAKATHIIKAIMNEDWEEMLKIFTEGVEHRAYQYKTIDSFLDWNDYEDYVRYVEPARSKMKNKCLDKAFEYLGAANSLCNKSLN